MYVSPGTEPVVDKICERLSASAVVNSRSAVEFKDKYLGLICWYESVNK